MAKKLALDLITKLLGEFVELNEDNLDLSLGSLVWSGQIILHDLKLKHHKIFRNYNLNIVNGCIKKLELIIPWTSLLTNPVKVFIDGVYLQVGPLNVDALDRQETAKRIMDLKMSKLKFSDKFLDFSNGDNYDNNNDKKKSYSSTSKKIESQKETSGSYMQQWGATIMDNIEITLKNIHFRYEDNRTYPGSTFSSGLTLDSFTIVTCADDWIETFVARNSKLINSSINKMLKVENLGIYWNPQSKSLSNLSFSEWINHMKLMIFKNSSKEIDHANISYLLSPSNNLIIKLKHNEKAPSNLPKFDIVIESTNLNFSIDRVQYTQLNSTIEMIGSIDKQRQPYTYRPVNRPVSSQSRREWWKYACKLVIKRKKYIKLVKKTKTIDDNTGWLGICTPEERKELKELEIRLPLHALMIFRHMAAKEMQNDVKIIHLEMKNQRQIAQAASWWKWSTNNEDTSDSEDDNKIENIDQELGDDLSISSIINELEKPFKNNKSNIIDNSIDNDSALMRVSLKTSASLNLSSHGKSIASAAMAVSVLTNISISGSITALCELNDMLVIDNYTPTPALSELIKVKKIINQDLKNNEINPSFSITFDTNRGKSKLRIEAERFEFILNKLCIQQLLYIFTTETKKDNSSVASSAAAAANSLKNDELEVIFKAHAPKIIIPEDCSSDSGYLLLDTGFLDVRVISDKGGISCNINLSSINAGLPLSVHDMYLLNDQSLHLIKPFDIVMNVQNIDQSLADMTMDIEIKPELKGELSAVKLSRLLHVLGEISQSFSKPANIISLSQSFTNQKINERSLHSHTNLQEIIEAIETSNDSDNLINIDPNQVGLKINVKMPIIILELTYDTLNSNHLVFEVKALELNILIRPYDLQIEIDLNEFNIKDSKRALSQQYLAKTPNDCENLIHISYLSVNNSLSPLFKQHSSEIVVNFAILNLNLDVITTTHLQPFMSVLLSKNENEESQNNIDNNNNKLSNIKSSPRYFDAFKMPLYLKDPLNLQKDNNITSPISSKTNNQNNKNILKKQSNNKNEENNFILAYDSSDDDNNCIPNNNELSGTFIILTLGEITFDLLRPSITGSIGEELDNAFSFQVSGMTLAVDILDLLTADLRIHAVDIIDNRRISKDYAFKKILCPVFDDLKNDNNNNNTSPKKTEDNRLDYLQNKLLNNINNENSLQQDLLHLTYHQETSDVSFLNIIVLNMTSYASIDTIIDLADVGSSNLFGVLDLLSSEEKSITPIFLQKEENMNSNINLNNLNEISSMDTLNINVAVTNPRLILLDDPTTEESRAIVCRCGIQVHLTKVTKTYGKYVIDTDYFNNKEITESLHLSVKELEVFVLCNIMKYYPLSILEKMGLEYHLRIKSINEKVLFSHTSIDIDNINARVSINDVILAHSILMRKSISESSNVSSQETDKKIQNQIPIKPIHSFDEKESSNKELENSKFTVNANIGSISFVAINDFHGQNIPVIRFLLDRTTFYADGNLDKLCGDGSLIVSADFYNQKLSIWEPILDRWNPTLNIILTSNNTICKIKSEHTMQFTVSGIMLEKLLETYSILLRLEDVYERNAVPDLIIYNNLGPMLDIDIYHSVNKTKLLTLNGGKSCSFPREDDNSLHNSEYYNSKFSSSNIPTLIDIYFKNKFGNNKLPLYHIPLNTNKQRSYNIHPKKKYCENMNISNENKDEISKNNLIEQSITMIQPIQEIVYECSRYEPITGTWRKPFLLGDHYEWTDASGTIIRDMQTASILPNDKWEWQTPWNVDVEGIIGEEIDKDGYEYGTTFSSFSVASKRRIFQSMDCVRRRRWIRMRVPIISLSKDIDQDRLYSVLWDVKTLKNGSKIIEISSGLQVKNLLPFPIIIALDSSLEEVEVFEPIKQFETFCIPLSSSHATRMKIRPYKFGEEPYEWSQYFFCHQLMYNTTTIKDIICTSGDERTACFRIQLIQLNKSLTISCIPYFNITNKLLCDVHFRCSSSDNKEEVGTLKSGTSSKLTYINLEYAPTISFNIGNNLLWSDPVSIELEVESENDYKLRGDVEKGVDIEILYPNGYPAIALSMLVRMRNDNCFEIDIFSKGAFVDKTGLGIAIWSCWKPGAEIVRTTCYNLYKNINPNLNISRNHSNRNRLANRRNAKKRKDENIITKNNLLSDLFVKNDEEICINDNKDIIPSVRNQQYVYEKFVENDLNDFHVNSPRQYQISTVDEGDLVYTDMKINWSYLPDRLKGQLCIKTSFDDSMLRSKLLIKFQIKKPALILILIDSLVKFPPNWLHEDGYRKIVQQAMARRLNKGVLYEYHYTIYGKHVLQDEIVNLKGNWCRDVKSMYSVFIIPIFGENEMGKELSDINNSKLISNREKISKIYNQVTFDRDYYNKISGNSWINGDHGLSFFSSYNDIISLSMEKTGFWSDDIDINMTKNSTTGSFELLDYSSLKNYQLSYIIKHLPGIFSNTQILTVIPRYCIVNCMDEPIFLKQKGSNSSYLTISPYQAEGWHKNIDNSETNVNIRCKSSLWSLGSIDINEIGSSEFFLPIENSSIGGIINSDPSCRVIINVEVKVAEANENCSIVIIISRASIEGSTSLAIKNESDVYITIKQADLDYQLGDDDSQFEICIPPGKFIPFGWADPDIGNSVLVTTGNKGFKGNNKRIARISFLKAGEMLRLPDSSGRGGPLGEVILSVITEGGGRVLKISRLSLFNNGDTNNNNSSSSSNILLEPKLIFEFNFASFGLSLVVEKPVRRELLSLYIDGLEGCLIKQNEAQSFEFMIMDIQIDNYSETTIYPVLLHSTKKEIQRNISKGSQKFEDKDNIQKLNKGRTITDDDINSKELTDKIEKISLVDDDLEVPFLQFTMAQETIIGSKSPVYKYIGFRILEMSIQIDSSTLQLIFTDLFSDLKIITKEQSLATATPKEWLDEYNKFLLSPEQQLQLVDVNKSYLSAKASKMYFEKLIIHPIKIAFTFVQTPFPRKRTKGMETLHSTFINVLTSFAGVDNMHIKLNSFEVEDAMQSIESLVDHITNKTLQDVKSQLAQIAGSLAVLGSPMGFARKIGGGVKQFFYEPYLGLVNSPQDFVIGIGKGTSSLFSATISGFMNSTVVFVGTASQGISHFSGDQEYNRKRALKNHLILTRQKERGIMGGIVDGSENLMSGIVAGMSGLVLRPLEEAKRRGVGGFIAGLGLGLIGAAVKPMLGFADGLATVASSISYSVTEASLHVQLRPPRALERSITDSTDLVLVSLNLNAAEAQEFIINRSKRFGYDDAYLSYIQIGEIDECIILSETYLFWRRGKFLWGRTWANISHIYFLGDSVGIILYGNGKSDGDIQSGCVYDSVTLPCKNRKNALQVYNSLYLNSFRMGNPTKVIPIDLISQYEFNIANDNESLKQKLINKLHTNAIQAGELDGYRFGTTNKSIINNNIRIGSEYDTLKRADEYFKFGYKSWENLDEKLWLLIFEWERSHQGLNSARLCIAVILNRSNIPIQIARLQMINGKNVKLIGSESTNYDTDSKSIMKNGSVVIYLWAFPPSPIEVGHIKANIYTAAFNATFASTQKESICESKGGFIVGFLEKTVTDMWSKYVLYIS